MAKANLSARLKRMSKSWTQARKRAEEESFFTEIPDGMYEAQLIAAQVAESQSSGRLQINWEFTVMEGEQEGNAIRDYQGIETEDAQVFMCRRLERLGVDTESFDMDELQDILDQVVETNPVCQCQLRTKGEFQNMYIRRVLEADDYEEVDDEEVDE
ncbi:unnamed protein product, partial [marine sediment metagenome]